MAQAPFDVRTADFLGGSGMPLAMPKIYAPGEEPNPKNPGGISNNELKRRRDADTKKQVKEHYDKVRAENNKAIGKRIVAERKAFEKTQPGFWGRAASDLKVLGPAVLKVAGTAAAVVATGGAAAGAIGLGAGLAGITAAAVTADKVIGAINTGGKVVSSVKKGDVAGLAGAAKSGLAQAGIKTPPLPSAAKAGSQLVAALPKNIVSDAKTQLASAKQITSSAKAAIAAPKAAATAAVKAVAKAPAIAINTAKQAAGKAAEDKLRAQLDPLSLKLLDTVKGAKIVVAKNGKVSVSTPAAATAAAALFTPALTTAARPVVQSITSAAKQLASIAPVAITRPTSASASIAIKPPAASSKPPAMVTNRPPSPSPSVGASTPAPASAPPMIKPPPAAASDAASSGPTLEGYLVRLNGTVVPRGRYRAA